MMRRRRTRATPRPAEQGRLSRSMPVIVGAVIAVIGLIFGSFDGG